MTPKFSLQNVLDVRHSKVEMLEVELGKLLATHKQTESQLLTLQVLESSLLDQLIAAQSDDIDLFRAGQLRLNILEVSTYVKNLLLELARQDEAIERKRAELVEAKQSEETLEVLKRKREEAYIAEQLQIEMRQQDDIYIARAFRNQQQGALTHYE